MTGCDLLGVGVESVSKKNQPDSPVLSADFNCVTDEALWHVDTPVVDPPEVATAV